MFLVDTEEGRIVADEEIKLKIATEQPYRQWLNNHLLPLDAIGEFPQCVAEPPHNTVLQRQQSVCRYTFEDLRMIMSPMLRVKVWRRWGRWDATRRWLVLHPARRSCAFL